MTAQQPSFAEFYAQTRDDCLRAVFATTGDRPAAEDYVAEAFARAWVSWRKVSRHPVPRAWVIKTALNLSVSSWRRRSREVPLGAEHDQQFASPDGDEPDSAVLAVLAGLPLTHATLTDWSVTSGPGHTVSVTIRNHGVSGPSRLRLARALRAVGVPALVGTALPRGCRQAVVAVPFPRRVPAGGRSIFTLRPAALPKGSRIAIAVPVPVRRLTHLRSLRLPAPRLVRPVPLTGRRGELARLRAVIGSIRRGQVKLRALPVPIVTYQPAARADTRAMPAPRVAIIVPGGQCVT